MEPGFESALEEAQHIEVPGLGAEGHENGGDAPPHRDPHDRLGSADPFEDEVAGDLEQEIAQEEDTGAGAVDGLAPAEIVQHGELGETDIDAVDPGQDVDDGGERQDTEQDLPEGLRSLVRGRHRRRRRKWCAHCYPPIALCLAGPPQSLACKARDRLRCSSPRRAATETAAFRLIVLDAAAPLLATRYEKHFSYNSSTKISFGLSSSQLNDRSRRKSHLSGGKNQYQRLQLRQK